MRGLAAGLVLALFAGIISPLAAQSVVQKSPIVTLDQEQLFTSTKYGVTLQARIEAESAALLAENRKIDAALEAEERDLTAKRATMEATAFRTLADAFDKKANELRSAQEAKAREVALHRDQDRQQFFKTIAPILGDYMVERGAVAILDKAAIVVSLGSIDITKEVIVRIDQRLGDGSKAP